MFLLLLFPPVLQLSLPGLKPGENPSCPASGPNEVQALMSHGKNSVRDKATRGGFVRIRKEAHSPGCGPLPMARARAMEFSLARFCEQGEFIC